MNKMRFRETGIKKYRCLGEQDTSYILTVCDGMPITVEWTNECNLSNVQAKKVESSQVEFESAVKICISKLLKNNLNEFLQLYKELQKIPESVYFQHIQMVAQKEYQITFLKKERLENLFKNS